MTHRFDQIALQSVVATAHDPEFVLLAFEQELEKIANAETSLGNVVSGFIQAVKGYMPGVVGRQARSAARLPGAAMPLPPPESAAQTAAAQRLARMSGGAPAMPPNAPVGPRTPVDPQVIKAQAAEMDKARAEAQAQFNAERGVAQGASPAQQGASTVNQPGILDQMSGWYNKLTPEQRMMYTGLGAAGVGGAGFLGGTLLGGAIF